MKSAKFVLFGSAALLAVSTGARAADLPLRKAAPVDYVRVCDWTGAGFFYIPGTDTCLQISGYLRAEYAFVSNGRALVPGNPLTGSPTSAQQGTKNPNFTPFGNIIYGKNRDQSGFFTQGRIAVDARTQTAYGTVRTYVRYEMEHDTGAYGGSDPGGRLAAPGLGFYGTSYLDKGFIQFAGITAGRVQSFFDFNADVYNYEGYANSDNSSQVIAYTYNFAGGVSSTFSIEDPNERRYGIGNFYNASTAVPGTAAYSGAQIPDLVGVLRIDQAWGAAQLSGAFHQLNTASTALLGDGSGQNVLGRTDDGFAVRAGVNLKLPMLAAGDELWLEAGYERGALAYVDTDGGLNGGFYNSVTVGGFQHLDRDAYAIYNPTTNTYGLAKSTGFSASFALNHYFTPNFHDVVFGSYEHLGYGKGANSVSWTQGGIGGGDGYRIGNQFLWDPAKNLEVGLEVMYMKVDQSIPGLVANPLPVGIAKNPDAIETRLRIERDF